MIRSARVSVSACNWMRWPLKPCPVTVQFQIGNQKWGNAETGGALGADSPNQIGVRQAYIDWMVPQTDLKVRMGLHEVILPNKAGGTAVMDAPVAGVVASYQFNETVGLTALWMRPFNDNYVGVTNHGDDKSNYLDNMDLFGLMVPVTLDGFEITPWAMFGMKGKNTTKFADYSKGFADGNPYYTLSPYPGLNGYPGSLGDTSKAYGSMFWAGLPFAITAGDPLEHRSGHQLWLCGRHGPLRRMEGPVTDGVPMTSKRRQTPDKRQGWLAKALAEYKMRLGRARHLRLVWFGRRRQPQKRFRAHAVHCPLRQLHLHVGRRRPLFLGWSFRL